MNAPHTTTARTHPIDLMDSAHKAVDLMACETQEPAAQHAFMRALGHSELGHFEWFYLLTTLLALQGCSEANTALPMADATRTLAECLQADQPIIRVALMLAREQGLSASFMTQAALPSAEDIEAELGPDLLQQARDMVADRGAPKTSLYSPNTMNDTTMNALTHTLEPNWNFVFADAHGRAFSVALSCSDQTLAAMERLVCSLQETATPWTTAKIALQQLCGAKPAMRGAVEPS